MNKKNKAIYEALGRSNPYVFQIQKYSDFYQVLSNPIRKKILDLAEQPRKMTDLQKDLNISRGSLRHHLNLLEKFNLIFPMQRNNNTKGRPTYIQSNKSIKSKMDKEFKEAEQTWIKETIKTENIKETLNLLSSGMKSRSAFNDKQRLSLFFLEHYELVKAYFEITPEGRETLNQLNQNETQN